jgi:hypothetical protein
MLKRLLMALPYVALGVLATTQAAFADFDPTSDELSIGTFIFAVALMALITIIYAVVNIFGLNRPGNPDIPDHAHDFRYAHQHHDEH